MMFDVSCLHFVVSIIVRFEDTCHLFHDLIANDCRRGENDGEQYWNEQYW